MNNKDEDDRNLSGEELIERFTKAVDMEIEIAKIKKKPVALYDSEKRQAYLEYPDGRREYFKNVSNSK